MQDAPFAEEEIRTHLKKAAAGLYGRPEPLLHEVAASIETLASGLADHIQNLEDLERRLTVLEDKIISILRTTQTDEELLTLREALDRELKPYRGRMTADQLAMLERRYLDTALLERAKLPRLSLFYLH